MANEAIVTRGIDVVFYLVTDMQRARTFYEEILGVPATIASDHWVEYDLPGGMTFALGFDPREGWKESSGVMFGVANVDHAVKRAVELGGQLQDRAFEGPACRAAMVRDTEGNTLLLHERRQ